MLDGKAGRNVKLKHPSVIGDGLKNIPSFLLGDGINGGGQNFWANPVHPRVIPKRSLVVVPNGHPSYSVEELHVIFVARVSIPTHGRSSEVQESKAGRTC
jgi:hypothetical protein